MLRTRIGVRFSVRNAFRGAVALLLLGALCLGVLPFSVEQPLPGPGQESACRFEPIDVCGAGDGSLGMLADTPVLLAESVAVIVAEAVLLASAVTLATPNEGFAPGVHRPPRLSC